MKRINIAIDGYAGCGKSTTAKEVAKRLQYTYIDTGAMYRGVAWFFLSQNIPYEDAKEREKALQNLQLTLQWNPRTLLTTVFVNGEQIADTALRSEELSAITSQISQFGEVRAFLVQQQRKMAAGKGVVMEGRDIGTVVLPDAELKIFMTASLEERARRRWKQLQKQGQAPSLEEVKQALLLRDQRDTTRSHSPLKKAPDAIELDTTTLTIEEQVNQVLRWAKEKIYG